MNQVERAERRARRLYRSSGFQGAYVKGARAALAGRPIESCPYVAKPGTTGWRVWRRSWLLGYRSVAT